MLALWAWAMGEAALKRSRSSALGLVRARRRPSSHPHASTKHQSAMSVTAWSRRGGGGVEGGRGCVRAPRV